MEKKTGSRLPGEIGTKKGTNQTETAAAGEATEGTASFMVGVGASAGGLEAFTELLTHLPDDTGMAFVLIQHLDPSHESHLTELLSKETKMPVTEVKGDTRVAANHVYVISPQCNLSVSGGVLHTSPRPDTGQIGRAHV